MIRPEQMKNESVSDLKLAIKSSFPNAKSTLALLIMMWKASDCPAKLTYSVSEDNNRITVSPETANNLISKYSSVYSEFGVTDDSFIRFVNDNQMFKQHLEALIVAFELVWRIAQIKFTNGMAASTERTGGYRFPKTLVYTSNMDIIDILTSSDELAFSKVLLRWIGCPVPIDDTCEVALLRLLTCLSEEAIYRMEDDGKEVLFNTNNVYIKLLESNSNVDINGSVEPKGSLRVLKSALSEGMNPYLYYSNNSVAISQTKDKALSNYQQRVDAFLSLSKNRVIYRDAESKPIVALTATELDISWRITGGANYLLYGVPGSGKSHTVKTEYCDDEERMERVVFHPDYTYSDFVGQIMPRLDEKLVYYDFVPGPFTLMLEKAYNNPEQEFFLVIEELNRGNAPAIFGEVFQLLDRKEEGERIGESSYGITNNYVAAIVYKNPDHPVYIPSNLNIVATMNTSDQNVFTLDTAFQRRWRMRMIENNVEKAKHANEPILDSTVTWKQFNMEINKLILESNARLSSSEDKRLGAYFVTSSDLKFNDGGDKEADKQNSRFPEKVLKYLWDDAFKFSREVLFDVDTYPSLEDVIRTFKSSEKNDRFKKIFREGILGDLDSSD